MSTYINLLNENEARLHSAASESKPLKIFAALAVLGLIVYAVSSVLGFFSTTLKASGLKSDWSKQEAQYNEAIVNNTLNIDSARAKAELSGWAKGRIEGIKLLEAIHNIIPEEIQITEINASSILAGIEGEPLRSRSAKKLAAPERKYSLALKGFSVASESEKPVFKLVEDLKNDPLLKSLGINVELDEASPTTIMDPVTENRVTASRFSIFCRFSPRPYL